VINITTSSQHKFAETFIQVVVGGVGNIVGVLGCVQLHCGLIGGVWVVKMTHQDASWTSGLAVIDDCQKLTGD